MGPALCQLRGRGGGHPGEVGVTPAGGARGREDGSGSGRGGFGRVRARAPAPPLQLKLGPGLPGVQAAWGALRWAKPWLSPSWLWAVGYELGARRRRRAPLSPSSGRGLRTPGSLRRAFLPGDPNHPTQPPHTFYQPFSWGRPISEAGRLRLRQAERQRGVDPCAARPLSVFKASGKDRAKGQRIEVRSSRSLGSSFPSWLLPAPGE